MKRLLDNKCPVSKLQRRLKLKDKRFRMIWESLKKVVMKNITMKKKLKKKKNPNIWPTNQKIQILNLKLLLTLSPKAKLGKTDKEFCSLAKEASMEDMCI